MGSSYRSRRDEFGGTGLRPELQHMWDRLVGGRVCCDVHGSSDDYLPLLAFSYFSIDFRLASRLLGPMIIGKIVSKACE